MSLGPFWVNDSPANPVTLDLRGQADLTAYTSATVELKNAAGVVVALIGPVAIVDGKVTFVLPTNPFTTGGLFKLVPTVTDGDHRLRLRAETVVVQEDNGWHTVTSAREEWKTQLNDLQLFHLLEVSRLQCEEYAPELAEGEPVPVNYRQAQLLQARESANAFRVDPSGNAGSESYSYSPHPMSWKVQAYLRPTPRIPAVG
ncbi:hypothetical protein DOE76_13920 [Leifsonia sp. ku-ls]|nr:hypothetical protein DOE76_13920 [Leifsonia sp. ku-ls]